MLGLIFTSTIVVANSNISDASSSLVFGLGPFEQGHVEPVDIPLSANSIIFVEEMGYLYGVVVGFNWNPSGAKWILKNPSNEAVYTVAVDMEYRQISGLPDLPDWAAFFPITWNWFFSPTTYVFRAKVPDMNVPAFPMQGIWRAELYLYDMQLGIFEDSVLMVSYRLTVTESSLIDNIMAPIYISWAGMDHTGWGAFSFALPGLFWLTMPIWGFFAVAFVIRLWKGSFKIAIRDLRKGIEEINKRRKRKVVKK